MKIEGRIPEKTEKFGIFRGPWGPCQKDGIFLGEKGIDTTLWLLWLESKQSLWLEAKDTTRDQSEFIGERRLS